ncbi:MAG: di-heme oxidoredictase family protein [Nannocystales bacterium]
MKHRLLFLAALLLGCNAGDSSDESPPSSEARCFPVFSPSHPDGSSAQGLQALRQDAWRRELRFLDAADPGFAFRSVRPTYEELDNRFSAEDWFSMGGQLFTMNFTEAQGFGGSDLPSMSRFHVGERGGPDARRCSACHWRGGLAGAGDAADNAFFRGDGETESTALVRNPPPLFGAGWKQRLAEEITAELQLRRDDAVAFARARGEHVRLHLEVRGVSFGFLSIAEDGTVDDAELEGIDPDLVVRPFGWKGAFVDLRDVVEDASNVHHGMQSTWFAANAHPDRVGDGPSHDPDEDGVVDELSDAQVALMTMFSAMQDVPVDLPPNESDLLLLYARGRQDFGSLGCAGCHVPSIEIEDSTYSLPSRTDGPDLSVDLLSAGAEPRLQPDALTGELRVPLYSDLKRHAMGEALAEVREDAGIPADVFLTTPLWGVARSRPYLHDGRAPTLEDAILLHGGEAQASRDAFASLSEEDRAPLRVFLTSLTRGERLVSP